MPTYDYECKECGYQFELFQSIKDKPITECPECGKEVKRLIGGGMGIIFKGSGFYSTDNKRSSITTSSSGSKDKTENKDSSQTTSSTSSTPEQKTEGKKESVNV